MFVFKCRSIPRQFLYKMLSQQMLYHCTEKDTTPETEMLARRMILIVFAAAILLLPSLDQSALFAQQETEWDLDATKKTLQTFCVECHEEGSESGINIASMLTDLQFKQDLSHWNKVTQRLVDQTMPPADSDQPTLEQRTNTSNWINQSIQNVICDDGITPGRPRLRRLNRTEYANTIRDLLAIHVNAAHALPDDGAGGEGFDNAAETLFISPIHAEKYLDAAREALSHALLDPVPRERLLIRMPSDSVSPRIAAEQILQNFLPRAFRRPVSDQELSQYLELFELAMEQEERFETSITLVLEAALTSPKFLFHLESPATSKQPVKIDSHEMANRLAYFLWNSMPDEKLFDLARQNLLQDDAILAEQVKRMLDSPIDNRGLRRGAKVREFASSFTEQWLGTRAIGREFEPANEFARIYDSELEGGMKYEPIFFFEDLLSDNRSILELIDSKFSYLNNRLARHYGVSGEFREQPKRTELPEDSPRGGLLGMSAVLAVSSLPHRTSPVVRGKWILETLLGTPPPPPPPNVPELEGGTTAITAGTLRERLKQHRDSPSCASCHASLDPLGFGLENFDVLGRWRSEENGMSIDASGSLPDGTQFVGPRELKLILMQRKDQFTKHLTSKMLGFALGRGLTAEDQCTIDDIAKKVARDDYKMQTLVIEIVKSIPFRYKLGTDVDGAIQLEEYP